MLEVYSGDKKRVFASEINIKADLVPIFKSSNLISFIPDRWVDDVLLILDERDKVWKQHQEEEQMKKLEELKTNFIK